MRLSSTHDCELPKNLERVLPGLPPNAPIRLRLQRLLFKVILVSGRSSQAKQYLRSTAAITFEKRRHVRAKHWYIIHPFSRIRMCWERIMIFVLIFSLFQIPFMTSLTSPLGLAENDLRLAAYWSTTSTALDFVCLFDVFMNFVTGFRQTKTKEIVMDPWHISRNYVRGYFFVDFLSSLPLELIKQTLVRLKVIEDNIIYSLVTDALNLLKVFRLKSLIIYLNHFAEPLGLDDRGVQIVRLVVLYVFYLHWMACMHYYVPVLVYFNVRLEDIEPRSWVKELQLYKMDYFTKYCHCLSRAVLTATSMDYGHATPFTYEDMCVSMFNLVTGFMLGAFATVTILQARKSLHTSETKYLELMNQLKEYMNHKLLPSYLQHRLMAYYEYRFERRYFRENSILSTLSDVLCQEVLMHQCHHLVNHVAMFSGLPQHVIAKIVKYLKLEVYLPNDVIQKSGTEGDCMFFLSSGTVCIMSAGGREIGHLEDGDHFGEVALVTDERVHKVNITAVSLCDVYRLDRKDFEVCIARHAHLFSRILDEAVERKKLILAIEEEEHQRYEVPGTRQ